MLVLLSDLHITDESTARNVNPEAFDLFLTEVRSTAAHRTAKELRIVLLGDIFDLVRTDYWLRQRIPMERRPWGGTLDPETGMNADVAGLNEQFGAVLQGVLASDTAKKLAEVLRSLRQEHPGLTVTYVVGNHDRVLWNFPDLRRTIQSAIPEISEFAPFFRSDDYALLARHGHEWDVNCHGWEFRNRVLMPSENVGRFSAEAYRTMAIGEAVTAELMGGLIYHVRELGASATVVSQLMEVNNLRPLLAVFEWLDWIGAPQAARERNMLHEGLRRALDGLLGTSLAKRWDAMRADLLISGDLIDRLQIARKLLMGPDFNSFRGRIAALQRVQGVLPFSSKDDDTLLEGARSEEVFKGSAPDSAIQRVVYGHTHRARHDYFRGNRDGTVQMYVNTGTYLPLITEAADGHSFASSIQMTLLYAYRADEDLDRKAVNTTSLDIWNGTRRKIYA